MTYEAKSRDLKIDVEIIRKNNKNIYFRVKDDLKLYVSCPIFLKEKSIISLLDENEESILKLYDKAVDKVYNNEYFWYLGNKYLITISEDYSEVKFDNNSVIAPSKEELDIFYKKEVIRVFNEEVDIAKKCFANLPDFTLKFRKMSTRWGVCNRSKKTITLNTELLKKEIRLLDYVIIHEMCHFYEGNHGKKFWELVSKACPYYKEARKKLRD